MALKLCLFLTGKEKIEPKILSKELQLKEEATIDIIAAIFSRAFGFHFAKALNEKFPIHAVEKPYIQQMHINKLVIDSLRKGGVLEHDPQVQKLLQSHSFYSVSRIGATLKRWTRLAIFSLPDPAHEPLHESYLPIAQSSQEEHQTMVTLLFDQLSNAPSKAPDELPFSLLPLYNSVAIRLPERKWISWGSLVKAYGDSVVGALEKATSLLKKFPFHQSIGDLDTSCPIAFEKKLPFMPFKEFVSWATLKAIEAFFCAPLPEGVRNNLLEKFQEDESLRRDYLYFLANPQTAIPVTEHQNLFYAGRMTFNALSCHVKKEEQGSEHLTVLIDWAFASDREHTMRLHEADYRVEKPIDLKTFVPLVSQFSIIAQKHFQKEAISYFLMLVHLPKHPQSLAKFLIEANNHSLCTLTKKVILDFSHFDGERSYENFSLRLKEIGELIPKTVIAPSEHFIPMLAECPNVKASLFLEQVAAFNQHLKIDLETIESTAYFKALQLFLKGRIHPFHFNIFTIFDYEGSVSERADLLMRTRERGAKPKETDPKGLFRALNCTSRGNIPGILWTLESYPGEKPSKEMVQGFLQFPYRALPFEKKEETIKFLKEKIIEAPTQLTPLQRLMIFHELLTLQDKPQEVRLILETIAWIEAFIGEPLHPNTATEFLLYHPKINQEAMQALFKTTEEGRNALVSLSSPKPPTKLINSLLQCIAKWQEIFYDSSRFVVSELGGIHVLPLIAAIQSRVSLSLMADDIRPITRSVPLKIEKGAFVYPSSLPQGMVLSIRGLKSMHVEWKVIDGNVALRFSLIHNETFDSLCSKVKLSVKATELENESEFFPQLKSLLYHIGWDYGDPTEAPLESFQDFLKHPKISGLIASYRPKVLSKKALLSAVHEFLLTFRKELRLLFPEFSKGDCFEPKYKENHAIYPQNLMNFAKEGNTFNCGAFHSLIHPKILPENHFLISLFSSKDECVKYPFKLLFKVIQSKEPYQNEELFVIYGQNGIITTELKATLSLESMNVNFEDKEFQVLDGEKDCIKEEGVMCTLKAVGIEESRFFPIAQMGSKKQVRQCISYLVVQLKSTLYERFNGKASW
ncbi:MAG: hypothetical protein KDK60_02155 [Chlamydiia bacterium]|nr:hypothetical protein [Chlamydiia bacterium]